MVKYTTAFFFLVIIVFSCTKKQEVAQVSGSPTFRLLKADKTGLDFSNDLPVDLEMNIFKYMYYYNGGGEVLAI